MFFEEIDSGFKEFQSMFRRVVHKSIERLKNPIPTPKLFVKSEVLTNHFRSFGRNGMQEDRSDPDHMECINC